ncbi:MAG: hypothetical protein ACJ79J_12315 [Gemmatimonadaceae bacterium]
MPRLATIITVFALVACAKTDQQIGNSLKPVDSRASVQAPGRPAADSARNEAIATAMPEPSALMVNEEAPDVADLKDDTVADPLALVTAKIDTTVTLGAWLKSHPGDRVGMVAPVGSVVDDQFCRVAVARTRLGNARLVRSALFYMPAPPKGEGLPADMTTDTENHCQLGAMVLASDRRDLAGAQALRDSVAGLIDKRFGAHTESVTGFAGGVRGTAPAVMWHVGMTSVILTTSEMPKGRDTTATVAKMFAVAYVPGSGAADFDTWEARYEERHGLTGVDKQSRYADVDSAVAWAGLPAVAADLKTVVAYLRTRDDNKPDEIKPPAVDAVLLRALKAIHQASPSLSPPRRAAALLAGDIALSAVYGLPSADSGHVVLNALPSLDITLENDSEGGHYYAHPWLWDAYHADSTSRAGRVALTTLLGMWWPDSRSCDGDEYKGVIEHGEAALSRGDNNPLIHYYVGSAYKTIYDLAHFSNSEVGNPEAFKDQAEPARLKAIEHFRVALESLPDRTVRREAWIKVMQLLLRRSGEQPEYVCFPD